LATFGLGLALGRGLGFAVEAFAVEGFGFAAAGLAAAPDARLSLRVPGRERGRFPSNPGSSLMNR
jgi:hypothetical protein